MIDGEGAASPEPWGLSLKRMGSSVHYIDCELSIDGKAINGVKQSDGVFIADARSFAPRSARSILETITKLEPFIQEDSVFTKIARHILKGICEDMGVTEDPPEIHPWLNSGLAVIQGVVAQTAEEFVRSWFTPTDEQTMGDPGDVVVDFIDEEQDHGR